MLHKCSRFILAAVLAISCCPGLAYGAESVDQPKAPLNPLQELFYMISGYESNDVDLQSGTAPLYPNNLTPPQATNDIPEYAGALDILNDGILLGLGGNLYYLREASFPTTGSGHISAYRTLERYNIDSGTWTTLASLPYWMEYCSAVVFGSTATTEGQIVLCGTPMVENGGVPAHATDPVAHVYAYNPNDEVPEWYAVSADNVPVASSLVNNGGLLELVGGVSGGTPSLAVFSYELSSGAMANVGSLSAPAIDADVIPHDGSLYIYSYANTFPELQAGTGTPTLHVFTNGSDVVYSGAFPTPEEPADMSLYPSQQAALSGSLTSADSGAVFVGPQAQSGGTDTYTLGWGSSAFTPYGQTANQGPLSGTAACVYRGQLYALGSAVSSDGSANLIFRSTPMADASLISGNNAVWRKDSKQNLSFVFSPDYGRFKHIVKVDGKALIQGQDYESGVGTTQVTLNASFLQTLSQGQHTIEALFDDGYTTVTGAFTVDVPASTMDGYTRPAALARTFDPLPVIPLTLGVIAAGTLTLLAFRKVR